MDRQLRTDQGGGDDDPPTISATTHCGDGWKTIESPGGAQQKVPGYFLMRSKSGPIGRRSHFPQN